MDSLSPLFKHFTLSARVFYSGALCGIVDFDNQQGVGILHVLRRGTLRLAHPPAASIELTEPTLLFYRQPFAHRFEVDDTLGADLVCASVDFGASMSNPLLRGMPNFLCVPLADMPGVEGTMALMFDEAFANRPGREAGIDRLMEFMVVLLLRHAIDTKMVKLGLVAGLADARLAKAITAMHDKPEQAWTLEELAQTAGMSRARFAAGFKQAVGKAPMDYLTDWRISVAQTFFRRGKPMKVVAPAVGYSNPAAFSRVFAKRIGISAADWITGGNPQ